MEKDPYKSVNEHYEDKLILRHTLNLGETTNMNVRFSENYKPKNNYTIDMVVEIYKVRKDEQTLGIVESIAFRPHKKEIEMKGNPLVQYDNGENLIQQVSGYLMDLKDLAEQIKSAYAIHTVRKILAKKPKKVKTTSRYTSKSLLRDIRQPPIVVNNQHFGYDSLRFKDVDLGSGED